MNDKAVQELLGVLARPTYVLPVTGAIFYDYPSKGVALVFRKSDNRLNNVYLYSGRSEDYSRYAGELPNRITFDDTRADVERKLGTHAKPHGNAVDPFWASYENDAVDIHYVSASTTDRDNLIAYVAIFEPAPMFQTRKFKKINRLRWTDKPRV